MAFPGDSNKKPPTTRGLSNQKADKKVCYAKIYTVVRRNVTALKTFKF